MKTAVVALLLACLGLVGCSRSSFDPASEQARLLTRDAEWASVASAGQDVEKIISYWTDDALVVPPGQPIVEGKAAIRTFVSESLRIPGFKIHWVSDKATFSPDGQLAYLRGTNETTVPGPDGKPVTIHGRGVTVWTRDRDGQWRCAVDIWNEAPADGPGTESKK